LHRASSLQPGFFGKVVRDCFGLWRHSSRLWRSRAMLLHLAVARGGVERSGRSGCCRGLFEHVHDRPLLGVQAAGARLRVARQHECGRRGGKVHHAGHGDVVGIVGGSVDDARRGRGPELVQICRVGGLGAGALAVGGPPTTQARTAGMPPPWKGAGRNFPFAVQARSAAAGEWAQARSGGHLPGPHSQPARGMLGGTRRGSSARDTRM
jgi:hypothetical protein